MSADETAGGFDAAVQVNGCDEGFQSISQQRFPSAAAAHFLAAAQLQIAAKVEPSRYDVQVGGAYQVGFDLGERAFAGLGVAEDEGFGNEKTEDRTTPEFPAHWLRPNGFAS